MSNGNNKNYYHNNKDNKMTIKSRDNLNYHNHDNKKSSNNSQLLNFTSALHTQECEDGLLGGNNSYTNTSRPSIKENLSLDQF